MGARCFHWAKNGWRKPREELDRTSIWSHWGNVKLRGGLEEGLSIIIYMGLEQKGWIWVFPLGESRITAGFVAQNSYIRDEQRKLKQSGSTDWKYDLCMQELLRSKFCRELLEGSKMLLPMLSGTQPRRGIHGMRGRGADQRERPVVAAPHTVPSRQGLRSSHPSRA